MSALHESIRAFLMTDIVGSTMLTQERPVEYHEALVAHNGLAERVFAEAGGRLVKSRGQGDGLLGEFPTPASAVKAALDFRDQVAGIEVGGKSLATRLAIHYGPCFGSDDDFFGHTLNLCARLRDVGHPGQVLVTGIVADLLTGQFVTELGWHGLRDVAEPVRLAQVGDSRSFPKLRTDERFRMPAFGSKFVGRKDEIARVGALLEESRVVLIVGPGGIGKTRLAARVAEANPSRPAVFANLIDAVDQASVERVIAASFGEPSLNSLAKVFTGPTVLVLDNCEHVAEESRITLDGLIERYPDLLTVATSRVRIPFHQARTYSLDGLRDDGPELFRELARSDDATIDFSAADEAQIELICAATDGAPLLLELAAAHVHGMSLTQIRERLGELIQAGPNSLPGRHRGIDAVLSASVARLSDTGRKAAGALAWMPGGFTLDAAESLLEISARPSVEELVHHSLLRFDRAQGRYRFLEVIRTYLRDELGGNSPPIVAFHWGSNLAAALAPKAGDPAAGAQIEQEAANFRALLLALEESGDTEGVGHRMATDLGRFWTLNGFAEGRSWLSRFLALHPLPPENFEERMVRANAWNRLGVCCYKLGDFPSSLDAYDRAGSFAESAENRALAMSIRLNQGLVCLSAGRLDEARRHLAGAETFFAEELMESHQMVASFNLGRTELEAGNNELARGWLVKSDSMAQRLGDARISALSKTNLALSHMLGEEPELGGQRLITVDPNGLSESDLAYFCLAEALAHKLARDTEKAEAAVARADELLARSGSTMAPFEENLRFLAISS